MPYERKPATTPLLTVSGGLLVIAPRTAPARRASTNPYLRLLATPGARAFTAGNLIARLPMGMFSVSAVIMIAGSRGSYALAGAVTATGLAATAVVAPWTARLVDRYGQARVAVPATAIAALGPLGPSAPGRPGRPAHRELLRAGRGRALLHARAGPGRPAVRDALPGGRDV